ncbi:uracil-DNA glycosylase, 4 family protein [Ehrlichia chaffeensis str. Heartland]|nr:uracil-DNA glycosylase, 4 family protein [Ehrlichia chaffeensis str. Heartland]AHX06048.1 uracil-DNA glycosylase, 4 family protein [Ehrlichia chaffeensis str. Jax]AHX07038.1 uracil-DNA glycosylase, 4 family protein [Ehrlichia chaffeensis str. Liberty]AHX07984.1 uracil-DNA glycosylase, 4 family protein [Ehrlichia chaffeensis str. Osceola]AHX08180.1 uracil-DNA glycosylase, 4 family protein [Ehrlichia chaffeensis str. Saint Vincent]AHX09935.1 uracil-DNA glycosylase, 4 family protein [Ehrlichia
MEVLKFYHENGIDCTLEDVQYNVFTSKNLSLQNSSDTGYCMKEKQASIKENTEDYYLLKAQSLAEQCNTIEQLKSAVESFDGCDIKNLATNTVFADGNPKARVMLIGEAPGANEDLKGIPFCGASGMLLDKMLQAIGFDRTTVYISNAVFWRPPGNRRPTDFEIAVCKPFVEKHIALIVPQMLVLVGSTACYAMLDSKNPISRLRGRFHSYSNQFLQHSITTGIIFHPSYLLRQPMQKRLAWEDLKQIKRYFDTL